MILNPRTGRYETPPPRWFNKDTGEYENVKPMYFIDPSNPSLGFVAPSAVVRDDDAFRRFMEDKEKKRRLRLERERQEAEQARYQAENPPPPEPVKPSKRKTREIVEGMEFDEDQAQRAFRETTGKMFSKRGATQFIGPSAEKEEEQKRELERKYGALRPFAPSDAEIESLPDPVNAEEIINAWRNSPAVRAAPKKTKAPKTEGERVRALVRSKSGKVGWTYAAMRGSYRPPNTIEAGSTVENGWVDNAVPTLLGKDDDTPSGRKLRGWRQDALQSTAWWENGKPSPSQWKSRNEIREEQGRLAINPVTGKLEDIATPRVKSRVRGDVNTAGGGIEQRAGIFLLCST